MIRIRTVALLLALLAGGAASTLTLSYTSPNGSSGGTPATEPVAPLLQHEPSHTATPAPPATATPQPAQETSTPAPDIPVPAATVPVQQSIVTAPATPTPLSWPRTLDDLDDGPRASASDPAVVPPDAWFTQEAVDELRAMVDDLLLDRTGRYSVVITDGGQYTLYASGADERYEAASLYKLAVLVEAFRQRQSGRLAFDTPVLIESAYLAESPGETLYLGQELPVETLLRQMIAWSSNVAAWALLDVVGIGNVNRTLSGLRLDATFIEVRPLPSVAELDDGNYAERPHVTSAADLARLYGLLLAGSIVSPEASEEMLDLLTQQIISNRLPAYLPYDAVVAHKTGNLPGMVHDAGVIFTPAGPLVVAVLTEHVVEYEAIELIARLGALVYRFGEAQTVAP